MLVSVISASNLRDFEFDQIFNVLWTLIFIHGLHVQYITTLIAEVSM